MQKIKATVLDKLINAHVTSTELNLLLYISHYQFDRGNVMGVYYKDACEAIGVSYQAFYDALRGLQEKNIIMAEKGSYYDWDVLILDNDFNNVEANSEGYINTGHDVFHEKEFYALKAGEKLMALYIFKLCGANKRNHNKCSIGTHKLFQIFIKMLGVSKRVIQNYIKSIKKFYYVNIYDGKYWFTPKKETYKTKTPADRKLFALNMAKSVCRRNRANTTEKTFQDTTNLVYQYSKEYGGKLQKCFSKAFQKAIFNRNETKSNKYKWNRDVHPAFVHKLLRVELGLALS